VPDERFCGACGAALASAGTRRPAGPEADGQLLSEGERRQLTVLFGDLVGSTALSGRLDPEDYRAVVRRYQEAAGAVVERHGGHVAQHLGDGLLVYFGWPQTYDDAAERAVRAGLALVDGVRALDAPVRSRSASACTRARSWWRRSGRAPTCSARPRTWPHACRRRPGPTRS
jgi:class 3 adenylate cyclase